MAKIIYFGNEQLAQGIKPKTPIFDALVEAGHEICALILSNAHTRKPFEIAKRAEKLGIPIYFTKNNDEINEIIAKYQPEIGVLSAYGKIIKDETIEAFPFGIINIHPSLLPKYRGTTPIESALLNNDEETGVSVMRLAHDMDAGNILAQETVKITPETTKQSLYEELSTLGAKLIVDVLPRVLDKSIAETAQNHAEATFTAPLNKAMSILDTTHKSALRLSREVVAFAGFPKSKTTLLDTPCTILEAHVEDQAKTELDLKCSDGKYLVIDKLLPENSRPMDAKSFLNGHKK
ncbi:methionyl-tRNA formyltransferase [Candidatus Saccharibacteria bacterium]|nr:methionyl-tRNA formyltransferase [Candidatus Saccharibacteria bacterium]